VHPSDRIFTSDQTRDPTTRFKSLTNSSHHLESILTSPALSYTNAPTVLIVGVGLMGQHIANHVVHWLKPKRLFLADHSAMLGVGTAKMTLNDFGKTVADQSTAPVQVICETLNVTSEDEVKGFFERHEDIDYFMITAGISPKPLTPPEDLTKADVMGACEVNLWGTHNVICQGLKSGSIKRGARGVIVLSTSATVGSEGRASAAYEESKGGLLNLLRLQSRHFVEKYGVVINGLAPSPLRGPMAAQNPISAGRLQAVEDAMPMGSLTEPKNISAATMFFWASECWCVGEVLTTDGGYTKHRPIYGPLA
jgi:NAD(P)-dependent dehydrogenase (short-subunit alcohol dehydrogenase family)